MKKILKNVLTIITILSLISAIILGWIANFKSNEAKRYESNYIASKTIISKYRDANNNLVTEVTELRLTKEEVENSKDSAIRALVQEVSYMDIKMKNIERLNEISTLTNNSGTSVFTDTTILVINDTIKNYIHIKKTKIDDGYLYATLKLEKDILKWEYSYKDSIIVIDHKIRDPLTKKGKKRFFLFKLIVPRWIHKTAIKSLNPNTEITGILKIKKEKRKGLKR